MKKKQISVIIKPPPEGSRIKSIPMSPDVKTYLEDKLGKHPTDYVKEYLGSEKEYNTAITAILGQLHESLPEEIEEGCPKCNGTLKGEFDGNCARFIMQTNLTITFASSAYVDIINANRRLFGDKKILKELTRKFFESFYFINGKGQLVMNLDGFRKEALMLGFKTISKALDNCSALKVLTAINLSLNDLTEKEIQNEILGIPDENYIEHQKRFFEEKQRFFTEQHRLDSFKLPEKSKLKTQVSIPKKVLYFHYLQETSYYPYFDNHEGGKVKALKELESKGELGTTWKYFQTSYNRIHNYNTNRVAKNQVNNIEFVANQMLEKYPKAQKLALNELEIAQSKGR